MASYKLHFQYVWIQRNIFGRVLKILGHCGLLATDYILKYHQQHSLNYHITKRVIRMALYALWMSKSVLCNYYIFKKLNLQQFYNQIIKQPEKIIKPTQNAPISRHNLLPNQESSFKVKKNFFF